MSKFVIGITGSKGSGKDALATALVQSDRVGVFATIRQFQFAAPIYAMMDALLPFLGVDPKRDPVTRENKEEDISPEFFGTGISRRFLLQTLGTEWGRSVVSQDIWLNILQRRINETFADVFLITDVRFNNEAELVRKSNGMIVRVHRGQDNKDTHASEIGIDAKHIDVTVLNDGTLADLEKSAKRIWDMAVLFTRSGIQHRSRIFPVSMWARNQEETYVGDAPNPLQGFNLTDEILKVLQDSGVVVSLERMQQVKARLRAKGLLS